MSSNFGRWSGRVAAGFLCSWAAAAVAGEPERPGKAVLPESAAEGPRDLPVLAAPLRAFAAEQPYGKEWRELVTVAPEPKDKTGLGKAKTHPALSRDPAELQQQVQYLEPTGVGIRYGWVSVVGVRVFRYGKLAAVQLAVDRVGREAADAEQFQRDLAALAEGWKDLRAALGLPADLTVTRNDLASLGGGVPPKLPLRLQIEPARAKTGPEKQSGGTQSP